MTQALQGKVETEVSKVKDAMRAEIRTTDSQMSYAAATTFSVNPLEKNICIRKLNLDSRESTDEQVTLNKVNAIPLIGKDGDDVIDKLPVNSRVQSQQT